MDRHRKGQEQASADFVDFVYDSFRIVERGVASEVNDTSISPIKPTLSTNSTPCPFKRSNASPDLRHRLRHRRLRPVGNAPSFNGFVSRLATCAEKAWKAS